MKWLVVLSVILGLTAGLVPVFAAGPFTDVTSSTPYATAIGTLKNKNVLQGYNDGSFKPGASVNRAELLKIILEAQGSGSAVTGAGCFPDVQNQWFARYVCFAKSEGIISGYDDGLFRPEKPVSFAEAAKIFSVAYKQQIADRSGDWYTGYVRALESSKAIPTSINGLTKNLTRGEMAELMWRLSDNVTNQPSLGYMNVKYPGVKVNLASDTVQVAKSCTDLQAFAEEAQANGMGRGGIMYKSMDGAMPLAPMMNAPAGAGAVQNESAQSTAVSTDHSTTNVQVEGVDEGDIVKTDGTYLYVVNGSAVRIVKAVPGASMSLLSSITDDNGIFSPSDLYVVGNRLVVIGQAGSGGPYHIMSKSIAPNSYPYMPTRPFRAQARIFDVSDKSAPKLERTVSFDGSSVSTRLIGNKLYMVVNQPMPWYGGPVPLTKTTETDVLPQFDDSKLGTDARPVTNCASVRILPHVPSPQYLTVGVVDVSKPTSDVARSVVLGNAQNVYASLDNLYVAAPEWIYRWTANGDSNEEKTNVYRFAFTGDGIEMKAQGSVPGRILNQFSMDENGQTFRIATTKGQMWDSSKPSSNNLYVLNRNLETTGKIEDIALGEQIYSVRFIGDRAYMVTFKTVDPLFVIDTSDPRNPTILGKLKIPGYSNYLHPYDATHLIGFGKDVDESIDKDKVHSDNAVYYTAVQGMKIAMFDVTDVNNPKELWKEVIGDRGTDSPLLTDHKALLFEKDRNLMAFPVTVYKRTADQAPSDQGKPVFQGAYVYNVSLANGFQLKGTISQYDDSVFQKAGDYWYDNGKDVQRVVRIGESLLSISNGGVQSNVLSTLAKEGAVSFPETANKYSPCGMGVPCMME
jgi:uncharacterized secreted protein with C-terminal beta-propeller domain